MDYPCDRYILTIRNFLAGVRRIVSDESTTLHVTPVDPMVHAPKPASEPLWSDAVPTVVYFERPSDPMAGMTTDMDPSSSRFVIGIKVADVNRQHGSVRIQRAAVRAYFAPPARLDEAESRAACLNQSLLGARIRTRGGAELDTLLRALSRRERLRTRYLTPDEHVALVAIAVAENCTLAVFSPDARFPRHPLHAEVAKRLRCRILRRPLEEVPQAVRRQIRYLRFRKHPAATPAPA